VIVESVIPQTVIDQLKAMGHEVSVSGPGQFGGSQAIITLTKGDGGTWKVPDGSKLTDEQFAGFTSGKYEYWAQREVFDSNTGQDPRARIACNGPGHPTLVRRHLPAGRSRDAAILRDPPADPHRPRPSRLSRARRFRTSPAPRAMRRPVRRRPAVARCVLGLVGLLTRTVARAREGGQRVGVTQ